MKKNFILKQMLKQFTYIINLAQCNVAVSCVKMARGQDVSRK